jgi:hypothetical protein
MEMSHLRLSPAGDFLWEFPRKAEEGKEGNGGCNPERERDWDRGKAGLTRWAGSLASTPSLQAVMPTTLPGISSVPDLYLPSHLCVMDCQPHSQWWKLRFIS